MRESPAARQSLCADIITVPRIMETMNLRNGLSARINDFNCYHILRMATYFQPKPLFRAGRSSLLRENQCVWQLLDRSNGSRLFERHAGEAVTYFKNLTPLHLFGIDHSGFKYLGSLPATTFQRGVADDYPV